VEELYDRGDLRSIIEEYAIFYLGFLRLLQPPDVLFGIDRGRPIKVDAWNEDTVRVCLYLYLALLPVNEKLIHE
jgi:symplekin